MSKLEKMLGTCIFRDNDGELKIVELDKVIALVELKKEDSNINININPTDNCSEFEVKYLEKDMREKLIPMLENLQD